MKLTFRTQFLFRNRLIAITGAAGILGSAFAEAFVDHGGSVALLDIDIGAVEDLASTLKPASGASVIPLQCDVSNPDDVRAVAAYLEKDHQTADCLVNNAATKTLNVRDFFESTDDYRMQTWRDVSAVNLEGVFDVARVFANNMISTGIKGSVVQIASVYGALAPDPRIYEGSNYLGGAINTPAVYSATKSAVIGLTRHFATEWAGYGIRVNAVSPGGVSSGQNSEFSKKYSDRVPLGRMARASEIADVVLFLASDASSYMTGQNIMVDGGLSAW